MAYINFNIFFPFIIVHNLWNIFGSVTYFEKFSFFFSSRFKVLKELVLQFPEELNKFNTVLKN
jgi:hypothetical protein